MNRRVTNAILAVVTGTWVICVMADIVVKNYDTPAGVYAAFMATVGAAFGKQFLNKGGDKDG